MENNQVETKTTENVETPIETTGNERKNESNETKSNEIESKEEITTEEDGEGVEFTDDETEDKEQEEADKKELEKRSKFAQQRREKEEREKEIEKVKKEAYKQALIDSVDGVNPYTGDKIEDQHDIDEFLAMREMEKKGLDPIADYHKYLKDKAREEKNKTNFNASKLNEEQIKEDAVLFQKTYPNVKIADLQNDSRFIKFSEGKLDVLPLTKVYGDYLDFVKEIDAEVDKKARKLFAKAKSSPGPQETSSQTQDSEYYTLDQIKKMSQKEVSQNFEKVEKSLAYIRQKK